MTGGRRLRDTGGRGQTTQDFAVGISVFLLTVAFAFAFVPSIFTPFSSDVTPGSVNQADRVADGLIDDYSLEGRPNWLNGSFRSDLNGSVDSEAIRNRYGLPDFARVNVTLRQANDTDGNGRRDVFIQEGDPVRGRATAAVSRIVVVQGIEKCAPDTVVDETGGDFDGTAGSSKSEGQVCRLVIRVW